MGGIPSKKTWDEFFYFLSGTRLEMLAFQLIDIFLCKQNGLKWKVYSESAEARNPVGVKTDVNHDGLHCWTKFLPQAHRRREKPLALFSSCLWMRKCCPVLICCVTNSPSPSFLSKDADWSGDFHQLKEIKQFRVKLWGGCARIQIYILRLILSWCSDQSARAAVQCCCPAPGTAPHCAVVVWSHTPAFQVWPAFSRSSVQGHLPAAELCLSFSFTFPFPSSVSLTCSSSWWHLRCWM